MNIPTAVYEGSPAEPVSGLASSPRCDGEAADILSWLKRQRSTKSIHLPDSRFQTRRNDSCRVEYLFTAALAIGPGVHQVAYLLYAPVLRAEASMRCSPRRIASCVNPSGYGVPAAVTDSSLPTDGSARCFCRATAPMACPPSPSSTPIFSRWSTAGSCTPSRTSAGLTRAGGCGARLEIDNCCNPDRTLAQKDWSGPGRRCRRPGPPHARTRSPVPFTRHYY
jgi:hypothetical protein